MPILQVRVKPRSRRSALEQSDDGSWVAHLQAPPVDGQANAELIALIAERFGRSKSQVRIRTGGRGRRKLVEIDDL